MDKGDGLLNIQEAAEYLGFSVNTLRDWRHKGEGPVAIKANPGRPGRVRYRKSDLDAWIEEHRQERTAPETHA